MNKIQVARNFYLNEFQCKGENCCGGTVKLHPLMLSYIQNVRSYFRLPVIIKSAYRCPKHNKDVGGVKNSYHIQGMAVDWLIVGIEPEKLLEVAEYCGFTGLGLYKGQQFVHTDIGKKRSWIKGG